MNEDLKKKIESYFDLSDKEAMEKAWKLIQIVVKMNETQCMGCFGPGVFSVKDLAMDEWKFEEIMIHLRRWASINAGVSKELGLYSLLFEE